LWGEHGSLGVFIGFGLSTIASICMSLVMLHGKVFKRTLSYFGIIGNALLLINILLLTFIPTIQNVAVAIAAPDGLMALAWLLMVGIRLIRMGKYNNE
jgi:hypothetical protein